MQVTTGLRSILSLPAVYTAFQHLMGARKGWRTLARDYLKVQPGEVMLDVGCGPADILAYLPAIDYYGYDISPDYILSAESRRQPGQTTQFHCKLFGDDDLAQLPACDVALLSGVLHHLDDDEAEQLVNRILQALRPGGRLVSIDPCYASLQSPIARKLIDMDRGRNVRDEAGYRALLVPHFAKSTVKVVHRRWIPYTHCITLSFRSGQA